jgi:hypothetical protein
MEYQEFLEAKKYIATPPIEYKLQKPILNG